MREIEFIYFDLGKVIVNFDHRLMSQNVSQLIDTSVEKCHRIIFESGLQAAYESGQLTSAQYLQSFLDQSGTNGTSVDEFCFAISDIFQLNRAIIPLITQLNSIGFPIAILSNTCDAHWNHVLNRFPIIDTLFDNQRNILSFETKVMKPKPAIYEIAIKSADVDPAKIFFVDDREENVIGAKMSKIQSEVYQSPKRLIQKLNELGISLNL